MITNGNDSAFARPCSIDTSSGTLPDGDAIIPEMAGLTKREFFAAMALEGLLATYRGVNAEETAHVAVFAADCLIDELNKPEVES